MKLKSIETTAIEICNEFQQLTKNNIGKNLTNDIRENSKHLVALYQMRRTMDQLAEISPKHEVIDKSTGKSIGTLYDNRHIGNIMLSTNIRINSGIQHTEWHIRYVCRKLIL